MSFHPPCSLWKFSCAVSAADFLVGHWIQREFVPSSAALRGSTRSWCASQSPGGRCEVGFACLLRGAYWRSSGQPIAKSTVVSHRPQTNSGDDQPERSSRHNALPLQQQQSERTSKWLSAGKGKRTGQPPSTRTHRCGENLWPPCALVKPIARRSAALVSSP